MNYILRKKPPIGEVFIGISVVPFLIVFENSAG